MNLTTQCWKTKLFIEDVAKYKICSFSFANVFKESLHSLTFLLADKAVIIFCVCISYSPHKILFLIHNINITTNPPKIKFLSDDFKIVIDYIGKTELFCRLNCKVTVLWCKLYS